MSLKGVACSIRGYWKHSSQKHEFIWRCVWHSNYKCLKLVVERRKWAEQHVTVVRFPVAPWLKRASHRNKACKVALRACIKLINQSYTRWIVWLNLNHIGISRHLWRIAARETPGLRSRRYVEDPPSPQCNVSDTHLTACLSLINNAWISNTSNIWLTINRHFDR